MARTPLFRLLGVLPALLVLAVSACTEKRAATDLSGSGTFSCSVGGTIVSGSPSTANSVVVLSNVSLYLYNAGGGPYTITASDSTGTLSVTTITATSYTYPSNVTVHTGASGGISTTAQVNDKTTGLTASCTFAGTTSSTTNGTITITPSPSSTQTAGGTIALTATASSVTDPHFTFSQTNNIGNGVTLYVTGNSTANVTSAYAGTVTVTVNVMSGTSTAVVATSQLTLTFTGNGGGGGGGYGYATYIQLTPSPAGTVSAGTPVYLSAYAPGAPTQVFTFTLTNPQSGLSLNTTSATQATVTSSIATTAYVTVTLPAAYNNGYPLSASTYVTFTGSGTGSPSVTLSAPNGVSAQDNQWLYLTTSIANIPSPTYNFHQKYTADSGVTIQNYGNGTANVTSNHDTTVVIEVTVTSGTNAGVYASAQISLTFGSGSSSTLTCNLSHLAGTYYVGQAVVFNITSSTGEPLLVTYWDAGEPWSIPPSYPLHPPLVGRYDYGGSKNVRILAGSATRPGVLCNGGAYLTDYVYIY